MIERNAHVTVHRFIVLHICPRFEGEHAEVIAQAFRGLFTGAGVSMRELGVSLATLQEQMREHPEADHLLLDMSVNGEQLCRVKLLP